MSFFIGIFQIHSTVPQNLEKLGSYLRRSVENFVKKKYLLVQYEFDIMVKLERDKDCDPMTAVLFTAINDGQVQDVAMAISLGANVNYQEPTFGHTPLMQAVIVSSKPGGLEIIQLLLEAGANPNIPAPDTFGMPALKAAFDGVSQAVRLISESPNFDAEIHSQHLSDSYWQNQLNPDQDLAVTHLLRAGVNFDKADWWFQAKSLVTDPPNVAFYYNCIKIGAIRSVRELIKMGMSVDAHPPYRWPLTTAVRNNQLEVCRLLLEHGANPNVPERSLEQTPLCAAAYLKHWEIVSCLIAHGADTDILEISMTSEARQAHAFKQAVQTGLQTHHQMTSMHLALACHERVGEDSVVKQSLIDSDMREPNLLLLISGFMPGAPEKHQRVGELPQDSLEDIQETEVNRPTLGKGV